MVSDEPSQVVIGLSAVIVAVQDDMAFVLTTPPIAGARAGLPFGPFDPIGHRTFEIGLRSWVREQTGFELGYVEQLYTFGDLGRDLPLAELQGVRAARIISVGYLGLTPEPDPRASGRWRGWYDFFPWEDWRAGRPAVITQTIEPALRAWARTSPARCDRIRPLFALDGMAWNEERVLERYELLYEAGLAPEAPLASTLSAPPLPGAAMISDHRRILATGIGRLRAKMKYRPIVFELMPDRFTLSGLQRVVEAISGVQLHKQNFRRVVERTGLVAATGDMEVDTGGRPAALFRFNRDALRERPQLGVHVPRPRMA